MKRFLLVAPLLVLGLVAVLLSGEGLQDGTYRKRAKPATIEKWRAGTSTGQEGPRPRAPRAARLA